MEKIIVFFKNWLFNVSKKNAIKKAQQLANEQRRKFLVLNFKGKPTVVSMKLIKFWISTKQVNKDADYSSYTHIRAHAHALDTLA